MPSLQTVKTSLRSDEMSSLRQKKKCASAGGRKTPPLRACAGEACGRLFFRIVCFSQATDLRKSPLYSDTSVTVCRRGPGRSSTQNKFAVSFSCFLCAVLLGRIGPYFMTCRHYEDFCAPGQPALLESGASVEKLLIMTRAMVSAGRNSRGSPKLEKNLRARAARAVRASPDL